MVTPGKIRFTLEESEVFMQHKFIATNKMISDGTGG